ncbi:MAG: glutathione S-transferase family protein [Myxococcales bacterium]|nr:glutathione S-transferase family protein [Myxococcales bacterium]
MSDAYRIFGSELSPYSVKVRSYFRYKGIAHEWIVRSSRNMDEFNRHAKLPLIPLVITPEGKGLQDSTPILEQTEAAHPEPSIHPADPALAFVSALLEEYGDEWGNKAMFHYRWHYPADAESAADRIVRDNMPDLTDDERKGAVAMVKGRMIPRLRFVGSSDATAPFIEGSFQREVAILEAHLAERPYVLGGCPAFADFGLFPQLYECLTDPTPSEHLRTEAPRVVAWIERMLAPKREGDFEGWRALAPTLLPLLREEVSRIFFPWTIANARAIDAGEKTFRCELRGHAWEQEAQKYHAKSLSALRQRYDAVADKGALDPILDEAGCRKWLA